MSKTLSELLAAQEPLFSLALRDLEKASGRDSVDVRLTADIMQRYHHGLISLGFDPGDTTGEEVYFALMAKIREHDARLAARLHVKKKDDVAETLKAVKKTVEGMDIPKSAWVLKKSVAKDLIKKTPPKQVMKKLGYRSVDSMLKKEPINQIFAAIRFAESPEWLNNFVKKYKSLKPSDFETRKIDIVIMPSGRWCEAAKDFIGANRHNITHLKELGVVIMLPMHLETLPGIAITSLPLVLHYINEIRQYSAYFKLQQVKPKFGALVADTIIADPGKHAVMAGSHVHWRVIQRFFGKQEFEYHPEIFEPHVQPEDLYWRKAEEIMYDFEPELKFWKDMEYVGAVYSSRPVTFNLMDNSISYMNQAPYDYRAVYHFRGSLWNEVYTRYMGQKTLEEQVLSQLDADMLAPEKNSALRRKLA
jgi:ASC-1-like (ASCH) protein